MLIQSLQKSLEIIFDFFEEYAFFVQLRLDVCDLEYLLQLVELGLYDHHGHQLRLKFRHCFFPGNQLLSLRLN